MKNFLICVILIIFSVFVVTNAQNQPLNFGECTTPANAAGLCQYLRQCTSVFNLLLKGNQLTQDQRIYLSRSQCGYRDNQPLVCCPDSLIPRGNSDVLPQPGECGIDPANRIIGGTETDVDEFPWMALLEYTKPQNRKGFHCGGVLISRRYVVTASHCVNGKDIPTTWALTGVRLGEHDLSTETDCITTLTGTDCNVPSIDVPITEKIPHEAYDPQSKNQANDIALLRLQYDVATTDFVKPICLPRQQQLRAFNYDGIKLDVAGWGKTETVSQSNVKLKVRVDGVNIQQCSQVYNRLGVTLQTTQVCAGGERGFDSCRGDSGGPIMTVDRSGAIPYWYLVGVVSFGPSPCGQEGWPGVYTRMGSYIDWIESKVRA